MKDSTTLQVKLIRLVKTVHITLTGKKDKQSHNLSKIDVIVHRSRIIFSCDCKSHCFSLQIVAYATEIKYTVSDSCTTSFEQFSMAHLHLLVYLSTMANTATTIRRPRFKASRWSVQWWRGTRYCPIRSHHGAKQQLIEFVWSSCCFHTVAVMLF